MRVLFYCQHVLGVGHVFRSLEIVKGLADHEVIMVTGGAELAFEIPPNMTHVQLPGLMMSPDFKEFIPMEPGITDVEDVLSRRLDTFRSLMDTYRPDIFLVELYPFGRRKFRHELLPILEGVRKNTWGQCKAGCSVRDILVEKDDMDKYVRRVTDVLNPLFDAVLVHSDPTLIRLDETFPGMDQIVPPVHYTGYVARKPELGAGQLLWAELGVAPEERMIVASLGGGSVGGELMEATLAASPLLNRTHPHRLFAFTGPYVTEEAYATYERMVAQCPWITLKRFTNRFPDYMAAADLSISLGGYNTTMNLLATECYGLMYPFMQNREQRMRTERLQDRHAVIMISRNDLIPERLAQHMANSMDHTPVPHGIDLDGGNNSARILETIAQKRAS
jgi:predicted glycosyltransferase